MKDDNSGRRNHADGKHTVPDATFQFQEEPSTIVFLPLSYITIPPALQLPLLSQQRTTTQTSTQHDDDSSNWLLYRYTILMLVSLVVFVVFLQIPNKKQTRETKGREKLIRKFSLLKQSMPSTKIRENGVSDTLDRASAAVADTILKVDWLQRSKPMIAPVDPTHPSRHHTAPPLPLIDETLRMLQKPNGIPLVAHGNHRPPEIIHLAYDAPNQTIRWWRPTSTAVASVLVSTIPLVDVVFVDVGKHTSALRRARPPIPDHVCFSLLTPAGSLDFETPSKLDRDRMVSAFCVLLDSHQLEEGRPHSQQKNWRTLYERSEGASSTSSSTPRSSSSSSSGLFIRGSSSNASSSTVSAHYTHF